MGQARHAKNCIQIQSAAKRIRQQVQLLPAPLAPRDQLPRSAHLKRGARGTQKFVPEGVMVEESVQIAAEDAPIGRDASIGHGLRVIAWPRNEGKRLGSVEVFGCAQVNLIAA